MITIRKASSHDVPLVVGYIEKRAAFDVQAGCFHGTLETSVERIAKAMFGVPVFAHAYLAVAGVMPVGMAFFHYQFSSYQGRPSLSLDHLYVDSNARRGGAGVALLRALAEEATAHHCTHVAWTADERNPFGIPFFRKLGATVVSRQGPTLVYSIAPEALAARISQIENANETLPHLAGAPSVELGAPTTSVSPFSLPPEIPVYKTLISADTYRDGGSLEASFVCADGTFETIWLQASLDPEYGVRYVHTDLFVFAGANRQGLSRRIEKDSFEEEALVTAMLRFLRYPKVAVPFSHRTPDSHYLQTVEALLDSIPNRIPAGEEAGPRI